jgi:hypothetical protein
LVSSMLAKEATFGESLAAKLPSNAAPFASIPWLSDNPQHCSLDCKTDYSSQLNYDTNPPPSFHTRNWQRVPDPPHNYIKSLTEKRWFFTSRYN